MNRNQKLLFSFLGAVMLCGIFWLYAEVSDNHPILPIKLLVAPAFIVGAFLSGNVHQPSAIGAGLVFLLYAWVLVYTALSLVSRLLGSRSKKRTKPSAQAEGDMPEPPR